MASEHVQTKTTPKPAPNAGTGLFAASTIKTGCDVCNLPASFATVLGTARLADTCSNCFGSSSTAAELSDSGGSLKVCTGCRTVKYCDKACQTESWRAAHKYECGIYNRLHPNVLPVNSRAVLRIILLRPRNKFFQKDAEIFEQGLRSHTKDIEQQDKGQFERILLSAKAVHEYSNTDLDLNTIIDYFGKLEINSFNLTTPFYDRIGLCVHPYVSFVNHSCNPNAVVGSDEGRIIVKALRDIEEGEQVFISYVDSTNPFEVRQKELSERYFFECNCSKCAKGTSSRENQFLSSKPDMSSLKDAEQKALGLLTSAKEQEDPSSAIRELTSAVSTLRQTGAWPITRQPFVQLRDELIVSLLEGQQFWLAFVHSAIRYLRVDPIVYLGPWHPLRNVHAWTLVKLAIHLFQAPDETTPDTVELQKHGINLGLIIYSVLNDLNKSNNELPSAERTYRSNYQEVKKEFEANGLNPANMQNEIGTEWAKMEKLVDDALKAEAGK